MKRSGRVRNGGAIKRIKSVEDHLEESENPPPENVTMNSKPYSRTRRSYLCPGFGFTSETKQFRNVNRGKGQRGQCLRNLRCETRRASLHKSPSATNVMTKLPGDTSSGKIDAYDSIETDTLDIDADTSHVTDAHRSHVTDADTSHVTDADTSHVTDADTSHVTDADISHVTDADISHVTDADTSHVTDADTSHMTDVDTSHMTDAGKSHVVDADTSHVGKRNDEVDNASVHSGVFKIPSEHFTLSYPQPTWPRSLLRTSSLNDHDLEEDVVPIQIRERKLAEPPASVPVDYSDMKPKPINKPLMSFSCVPVDILLKKKRPENVSNVQIHYEHKRRTLQDDFGALLKTYSTTNPDGQKYNRHIFYDVEPGAPADEMKVRNNNEMVLLNDIFVPDLSHEEVLRLFREVKVDGETRFHLVLRYVEKKTTKKSTWVWFQTSAVLCPDDTTNKHKPSQDGNNPRVEYENYKVLPGNETELKTQCRFRAKGTKDFIVIEDNGVSTSVNPFDILITRRYKQDKTGNVTFTASLRDLHKSNFIAISGKQIAVIHTDFWFQMYQISDEYAFKTENRYLAFDHQKRKITTNTRECLFQEIPCDGDGLDEVDSINQPNPGTSVCGPANHDQLPSEVSADKGDEQMITVDVHAQDIGNDEQSIKSKQIDICLPMGESSEQKANGCLDNADANEQMEYEFDDSEERGHPPLVYTSSFGSNGLSSFNGPFEPLSQSSLYDDVESDETSMTSSATESLTSSQSSSNADHHESGYLTSGSLENLSYIFSDNELSLFEEKPTTPKTPNTPMANLTMNDYLKKKSMSQ